jgi:hypothetical protein
MANETGERRNENRKSAMAMKAAKINMAWLSVAASSAAANEAA